MNPNQVLAGSGLFSEVGSGPNRSGSATLAVPTPFFLTIRLTKSGQYCKEKIVGPVIGVAILL
jgi:hypothetical protein